MVTSLKLSHGKCKVLFTKRKLISKHKRVLMSAVLYGFFQSGDMLNAAYETNWYENTSQIKYLLRTMVMRASKPVKAKAGLIGAIDLPLFATVRHITNKQKTYIHTYTHTNTHIYIYVHTYLHTYIHTCIHTHTYVHAYIYIYIYT